MYVGSSINKETKPHVYNAAYFMQMFHKGRAGTALLALAVESVTKGNLLQTGVALKPINILMPGLRANSKCKLAQYHDWELLDHPPYSSDHVVFTFLNQ